MDQQTIHLSSLDALPKELKNLILEQLPDIPSLIATVLSGPELYHAFVSDENRVVASVLRKQVHKSSMSDAIAIWTARRHFNKYWTIERIPKFFNEQKDRDRTFFRSITLSKALGFLRLHSTVENLAKGLIQSAVRSANLHLGIRDQWQSFNSREVARVEHALYRFELYCVFFGDRNFRFVPAGDGQRTAFWNHFAPWEIEQIACVSEYIQSAIWPFFETLSMTVPKWTAWCERTYQFTSDLEAFLLARMSTGLKSIESIINRDLTKQQNWPLPNRNEAFDYHFIQEGLDSAIEDSEEYTLADFANDPDAAGMSKIIKSPRHHDSDPGPEKVWRWAHQEEDSDDWPESGFVRSWAQRSLRSYGYVFVDSKRAERWFNLDMPKQRLVRSEQPTFEHVERDRFRQHIRSKVDDWIVAEIPHFRDQLSPVYSEHSE